MVRVILYIVTALLIILTIFGPQEDRYQLVFLMGLFICLLILMCLTAFEKGGTG
ncbi:hypothetical protein ACWOEJ_00950 [Enterococcus eurekensis]|uniref:Uncharacterized protein n=1 Tax=Enterococcus eurekensis TaxID=1159753 RepID=A0ABV9M5N4_9ENTE